MSKFLQKYRSDSIRLKNYNYSLPGYYFITICIKNRNPYFFGCVKNNNIILNNVGKIINKNWLKIPQHFNNVKLDNYIIMPDHVHGILCLIDDKKRKTFHVETCHGMSLQKTHKRNKFGKPNKKSVSMIINHFKGSCTRILKKQNLIFCSFWQPRFYDRIIRNKMELNNTQKYIKNNPKNWQNKKCF